VPHPCVGGADAAQAGDRGAGDLDQHRVQVLRPDMAGARGLEILSAHHIASDVDGVRHLILDDSDSD
jgi:hypothetical protein